MAQREINTMHQMEIKRFYNINITGIPPVPVLSGVEGLLVGSM